MNDVPAPVLDRPAVLTATAPDAATRPDEAAAAPLRWLNTYAALGDAFSTRLAAQALPAPQWVATSESCAALLGWPADWADRSAWRALEVLSGGAPWPGSEPLATVYSGHQFGVWAGQLGDGRALLLGEVASPAGPM